MMGQHVVSVSLEDAGVSVRCLDGATHRGRHLVMSMPFSALRLVQVDPPFVGAQAEAIATLPYHAAFQVHFAVDRPFWESDGLPPSFWSDGPLERFNALAYGANGEITSFMHYSNGDSAARYDRMPSADAARFVLAELERVRPAAPGSAAHRRRAFVAADSFRRWRICLVGTGPDSPPGAADATAARAHAPVRRAHERARQRNGGRAGVRGARCARDTRARVTRDGPLGRPTACRPSV